MDIPQIALSLAALILVIALIILVAWALKRFLGGSSGTGQQAVRRRDRRLGLVETMPIGNRHRLVLLRRDDVEHLVLIGGNTEVVVESTIPYPELDDEDALRGVEPSFGSTDDLRAPIDPDQDDRREPQSLRDFGDHHDPDRDAEREPPETRFQSAFASPAETQSHHRDSDDPDYAEDDHDTYERDDRSGGRYLRAPGTYDRGDDYPDEGDDDYRREPDVAYADTRSREAYEDEDASFPDRNYADENRRGSDDQRGQSRILSRFLKKDED